MACEICRERKVKCDAAKPRCGNCKVRNTDCRYKEGKAPPTRAKRTGRYRERLERLERLWEFHADPSATTIPTQIASTFRVLPGPGREDHRNGALLSANIAQKNGFAPDPADPTLSVSFSAGPYITQSSPRTESNSASGDSVNDSMAELIGDQPSTQTLHDLGSFMIISGGCCDFTGPSSGLSPFMTYDLVSASRNTGPEVRSNFLIEEINLCQEALLKMRKGIERVIEVSTTEMSVSSQSIKSLPPPEIAEEYLSLYFIVSQHHFPIVRREELAVPSQESQDVSLIGDISWYTLYNAVLAMGSFMRLSGDSYKSAKAESWGYFNNAFNMQTRLLPGRTSLMAVQAFCVLATVADHIGTPSLAQRCAAFAATLAVSTGLHKAVKTNENSHSDHESCTNREVVFWTTYFFDKIYSYQMGRPSFIDDEDISCPFPKSRGAQSGNNVDLLLHLVRFAYISSKIRKKLYSTAALNRDPKYLLPVRESLAREVAIWRKRIPPGYHAEDYPFRVVSLPQQIRSSWAILLRVAHANLICSIYKSFAFPLVRHPTIELDSIEAQKSEFAYLQAARELILLLGSLEMEADAPNWFFIYHLLKGVVPIFIHLITNPLKPSVKDDIALMHVANGIFARLEFTSAGDLKFPGVNEFPQLAMAIVEKATGIENCSSEPITEPIPMSQGSLTAQESSCGHSVEKRRDCGTASRLEDFHGPGNMHEFSMEAYSHLQEVDGPFDDLSHSFMLESYENYTL